MIAYAYRSGEIGFGSTIPDGALFIANDKNVESVVKGLARRAYDNTTLLVPGIPEAGSDDSALNALMRFIGYVRTALEAK